MECREVTSRAASSSSSGRIDGSRSASMVLPAPGGPSSARWCPPAAATSSARRPSCCPATSARSGPSAPVTGAAGGGGSSGVPSRTKATSRCRVSTARTRTPGITAASAALPAGTTTRVQPARAAAATIGSTPRTGRTVPSRPSSPRTTVPSSGSSGNSPEPPSTAAAMARSNADPYFGRVAGSRLRVIRRFGHFWPELTMAARTRSRASCRAVSGSPEITTPGSPGARSASTSTTCPVTPTRPTQSTLA